MLRTFICSTLATSISTFLPDFLLCAFSFLLQLFALLSLRLVFTCFFADIIQFKSSIIIIKTNRKVYFNRTRSGQNTWNCSSAKCFCCWFVRNCQAFIMCVGVQMIRISTLQIYTTIFSFWGIDGKFLHVNNYLQFCI